MDKTEVRIFLAHGRRDGDEVIEAWQTELEEMLNGTTFPADEYDVSVCLARDDYKGRSRSVGGWKKWPKSVGRGTMYNGQPIFHIIVVPINGTLNVKQLIGRTYIGRATHEIVNAALLGDRNVYAWNPNEEDPEESITQVTGSSKLPGDSWVNYARLQGTE